MASDVTSFQGWLVEGALDSAQVPGNDDVAEFVTYREALAASADIVLAQEDLWTSGAESNRYRIAVVWPGDVLDIAIVCRELFDIDRRLQREPADNGCCEAGSRVLGRRQEPIAKYVGLPS